MLHFTSNFFPLQWWTQSCSVVSDSWWPQRLNSPGQNTGEGAVPFSRASTQPRDRTQVSRIAGGFFTSWATREGQEYFSRGCSWPRNRTGVFRIAGRFFTSWATREASSSMRHFKYRHATLEGYNRDALIVKSSLHFWIRTQHTHSLREKRCACNCHIKSWWLIITIWRYWLNKSKWYKMHAVWDIFNI